MHKKELYGYLVEGASLVLELEQLRAHKQTVLEVDNFVLQKGECCYARYWANGTSFGVKGNILTSEMKQVLINNFNKVEGELIAQIESNLNIIRRTSNE